MQMPKSLVEATKVNTPKFSFADLKTQAKVISIYDGDTMTAAFDTLGLGIFAHNVRLVGIDTPEIKGVSQTEKDAAARARDYLRTLILDKIVDLEISGSDKYGRLLARVKYEDRDISSVMLDAGLAVPYDGGTKKPW
jgi:micrococcal nuclease